MTVRTDYCVLIGLSVQDAVSPEKVLTQLKSATGSMKSDFELLAIKEEMKDCKNRMVKFEEADEKDRRAFNKQLGEIANKQGRMVEDIVQPSMD